MRRPRYETPLLGPAKWIGTAAGVSGAVLIALNMDVVVYGFSLFLLSLVLWAWVGWIHREALPGFGADAFQPGAAGLHARPREIFDFQEPVRILHRQHRHPVAQM